MAFWPRCLVATLTLTWLRISLLSLLSLATLARPTIVAPTQYLMERLGEEGLPVLGGGLLSSGFLGFPGGVGVVLGGFQRYAALTNDSVVLSCFRHLGALFKSNSLPACRQRAEKNGRLP